jgi:hypothetical protein
MLKKGTRMSLDERGVNLIVAYHEAGETDEAFDLLRRMVAALATEVAHTGRGQEMNALILMPVRKKVELMYDDHTSRRLLSAFEQGCHSTTPLRA